MSQASNDRAEKLYRESVVDWWLIDHKWLEARNYVAVPFRLDDLIPAEDQIANLLSTLIRGDDKIFIRRIEEIVGEDPLAWVPQPSQLREFLKSFTWGDFYIGTDNAHLVASYHHDRYFILAIPALKAPHFLKSLSSIGNVPGTLVSVINSSKLEGQLQNYYGRYMPGNQMGSGVFDADGT